MPNLDYDPKNPSDLLGRPIAPGDVVVWSSTYGKSAAINVGLVERINFTNNPGYAPYKKVPQEQAQRYTLTLQPLQSTSHSWPKDWTEDPWIREPNYRTGDSGERNPRAQLVPSGEPPKPVTIHHVKNVVKLDPATHDQLWTPR